MQASGSWKNWRCCKDWCGSPQSLGYSLKVTVSLERQPAQLVAIAIGRVVRGRNRERMAAEHLNQLVLEDADQPGLDDPGRGVLCPRVAQLQAAKRTR